MPNQRKFRGLGLLVALIASSGVAYAWPTLLSAPPNAEFFDPFVLSPTALWGLVSLTMFCLGMVVSRDELSELRKSPLSVLLGLLAQCGSMPLLAWLAARSLQLEGDLAAGVILVGCVPGAMASNVLTLAARGNVSYSVCLTTVATLASPITVPVLLWLFAGAETSSSPMDALMTSWRLINSVVLPILFGFTLKEFWPAARPVGLKLAPPLASVALLWIIASVVAGNRERLSQVDASVLAALALLNLAGYASGILVGRLGRMTGAMRRALALEVGMQNAGVGTALAATIYGAGTPAQIPTAAYTFGCMLTGTMLAAYWGSHPVKSDSPTGEAESVPISLDEKHVATSES